jgi:hypothetical protein
VLVVALALLVLALVLAALVLVLASVLAALVLEEFHSHYTLHI